MNEVATLFAVIITIVMVASPIVLFQIWKQKRALKAEYQRCLAKIAELEKENAESLQSITDFEDKILEYEALTNGQSEAVEKLANQFINDSLKFVTYGITANNYETSIKKAEKVFAVLRKFNIEFPESDEAQFYSKIKEVFEAEVRKDEARQQQLEIKERIRDEQRAERERADEIKKLEMQEAAIAAALQEAKKKFNDAHAEEIQVLQKKLDEAHAMSERAKSQAELTRAGFVYVISNIGSFGENTFKVGMTRRLEPLERVQELSDASVPFPFDVHMMISCEDAPALEASLHRDLNDHRVNRVNLRKEFFKVNLETISQIVEKHHGKIQYRATPEALEYNESRLIAEIDTAQNKTVLPPLPFVPKKAA